MLARTWLSLAFLTCCITAVGCGAKHNTGGASQSGAGGTGALPTAGASAGGGAGTGAGGSAGGSAGSGAGSGAAADAGAKDGGSTSTQTARQACLAYVRATCNRKNRCAGQPMQAHPCQDEEDKCPDSFLSDGSARTVDQLLACATQVEQLSCSNDFLSIALPNCVTAGTRKAGQPCLYDNQCESLYCQGASADAAAHPMCKTCDRVAGPTDDCNQPGVACPIGQTCSSALCKPVLPQQPVTAPVLPTAGQPCLHGECAAGSACLDDPAVSGTSDPGKCAALPKVGEPCGIMPGQTSDMSVFSRVCPESTYCDASGTCAAFPADGQPCGVSFGTAAPGAAPLTCDGKAALCVAGTCRHLGKQGEPCGAQDAATGVTGLCAAELMCSSANVCVTVRGEGASPCDAPNTTCEAHTTCVAGTCVSMGLQGLFTAACGM